MKWFFSFVAFFVCMMMVPRLVHGCQNVTILAEEEWDHIDYYGDFLDKTILPSEHRRFCFYLYQKLMSDRMCILQVPDESFRPKGRQYYMKLIAVLIINSLSQLEKKVGENDVVFAENLLRKLVNEYPPVEDKYLDPIKALPLLFGRERVEAASCNDGKRKIYIYDEPGMQKYINPRISTTNGQEGVEPLLHRWLMVSNCRTLDPDEADFFYVPFYHNGYQREAFDPPLEDSTQSMHDAYNDLMPQLKYFDSYRRRDHIFLFVHEFWGARQTWHKNHVSKAILLVAESNPLDMKLSPNDDFYWQTREEAKDAPKLTYEIRTQETAEFNKDGSLKKQKKAYDGSDKNAESGTSTSEEEGLVRSEYAEHCLDCFDMRKDLVVPQHIDWFPVKKFREYSKPYKRREHRICYRGAFAHGLYDNINTHQPFNQISAGMIRQSILQWRHHEGANIGGHVTPVVAYYKLMSNCKFCMVPKGVGYTNGRLFESFFSKCIPVVFSDALRFPFDGTLLDWSNNLVIHVPSRYIGFTPRLLLLLDEAEMNIGEGADDEEAFVKGTLDSTQSFEETGDTDSKKVEAEVAEWPVEIQNLYYANKGRLAEIMANIEKASCWFDYYSRDPNCSPYEAIVRNLKRNRVKRIG